MLGLLALTSFALALLATQVLLSRFAAFALDRPNERSLHERPVPRTGGIAVLLGSLSAFAFGAASLWLPIAVAYALAIASFLDDVRGLPTIVRLALHIAAASVVVWYLLSPMAMAEMIMLVLAVAWITNLYNFMDGSDGLAGGMATVGFGTYALAAQLSNDWALACISAALAAASAAFLVRNFHPARLFMGDVGSIPLGFSAAALGIVGWRNDIWPLWFPIFAFGPFVADATITLFKRLVRGERVWHAHREHYYQRMLRMGLGHRRTAYVGYALMIFCAAMALWGRAQPPSTQAVALGLASVVLAGIALWVDFRWARFATKS
jgi:UDP-N-acetylmuramyl pentapeptide phosphotransferase/UDP-N-acetylglucosamine-1-phosphate transferase